MVAKIDALKQNHTWSVVPLPPNKRIVGCKWVFRIKYKADGSIKSTGQGLLPKVIANKRAWTTLKSSPCG